MKQVLKHNSNEVIIFSQQLWPLVMKNSQTNKNRESYLYIIAIDTQFFKDHEGRTTSLIVCTRKQL